MTKYTLNSGFITQKIEGKTTIFSGEASILFTLNETGSYIFNSLKLGWTEEKIIAGLSKKYKISKLQAKKDIEEFTKKLEQKKILTAS